MVEVFRTTARLAVVSPHGWYQLPSGTWVTKLPLVDARTIAAPGPALFAHLDYDTLIEACALLGAMPLRPETVVELNAHGYRIEPFTIFPDSSARDACEKHDTAVWQRLLDWDGVLPVANAGKPWVRGALPGKSRLLGRSKSARSKSLAPDAFGEWLQPLQNAHNRKHVDYSSLCTLERDSAPTGLPQAA